MKIYSVVPVLNWDEHMIRCSGCDKYDCECGSSRD